MSEDKNFDRFFGKVARLAGFNPIRALANKVHSYDGKDMVSLGEGRPNSTMMPIGESLAFSFRDIHAHLTEEEFPFIDTIIHVKYDREFTLNYNGVSFNSGLPEFVSIAKKLMLEQQHSLKEDFWKIYGVNSTNGSTDGFTKAITLLVDDTDAILCEEITYSGLMACAIPFGKRLCPVKIDKFGCVPEDLDHRCQDLKSQGIKPKMLYLVPNGQNPVSFSLSTDRKLAIYEICVKHDILLVIDDPYSLLQLGKPIQPKCFIEIESDNPKFLANPRVLRFDSFSKLTAPGFRVGLVTAPKAYLEKLGMFTNSNSWGISGPSQAMLAGVLEHIESTITFKGYLMRLQEIYTSRRDCMVEKLRKYVPDDLATFEVPTHGMFIWLTIHTVKDSGSIFEACFKEGVQFMPGGIFAVEPGYKSNGIRIAFIAATEAEMDLGCKRLGKILIEFR